MVKKLLIVTLIVVSFLKMGTLTFADDPTPTPTVTITPTPDSSQQKKEYQELQSKISDLEGKINTAQQQGKTLAAQIAQMDNQINLTQLKMNATQSQIQELGTDIIVATKKISSLESSLDEITKVLLKRIVATYQVGSIPQFQLVLSSTNASDLLARSNYLKLIQAHDKRLIYDTQQARNDYQTQKDIFQAKKQKVEALKTQLEAYSTQLDGEKQSKTALLAATKNDETKYQKLLEEARSQINAFKSFATSQVGGGASILPAQPSPDGWYYNQRDERWGNQNIGSSSEKVWEVGCLLTSMAMVMKKHGEGVTPSSIAGNSSYFFSDTAYMLIPWGGGKFTASWGYSKGDIDSKLSSGEPVIVGLKAGPFGMHFVVLKSGSSGSYVMNDPWNGPDLSFSSYYSTGQIFQYGYYR